MEEHSWGRWYAANALQKSNTAKGGNALNAWIYKDYVIM